jgi:predicted phage terminase large subunit-like protein
MNQEQLNLARSSPAGLGMLDYGPDFRLTPHVELMDQKLMQVADPKEALRRLMVTMPPRHGKSMMCSHFFPAWFLGTYPDRRIILCGYGSEFSEEWGGKARDVLERWGPEVFGVKVSGSSSAKSNWTIEGHRGGMVATGAGGPVVGRGADVLLIDDPTKGEEAAESELQRERMWQWFWSVARTRLEPGGGIVLVQTRWNEDDLAGRLLEHAEAGRGLGWELLNFPALAEEHEATMLPDGSVWTRHPGDALWPERYPREELLEIREGELPYWWAAMYQQRPSPIGGYTFQRDWFRYFDEDGFSDLYLIPTKTEGPPLRFRRGERSMLFATVDLATSLKETADYTVMAMWSVVRDINGETYLLLLDLRRERMQGPDLVPALRKLNKDWRPHQIYVESAGFQLAIVQEAMRANLPVRKLEAVGDKHQRSLLAQDTMSRGRLLFKKGAPWVRDLEDELLMFPSGKHDDQVDVVSYAARVVGLAEGGGRGGIAAIPNFVGRHGRRMVA